MLSIGITVCDADYKNLDLLLNQIKERVKVPYEIIIIDNREKYKNEVTEWKPSFSFGYNAFQFSARAKIIDLSKGEYIWFIDGDDEIGIIDNSDYQEDIAVFSYNSYPVGDVHITKHPAEIFSYESSCIIKPVLWNKFIKRSLFSEDFINKYRNLKIVTNEDTIWCYEALRHAKSLKIVDKVIYFHKKGLSNKETDVTYKNLECLVTGFAEMRKVLKELLDERFFKNCIESTYSHMMSFIPRTKDINKAAKLLSELIPKENFQKALFESVYYNCKTQEQFKKVINAVSNIYGKDFCFPKATEKVTFPDGHTEDYAFTQIIEFK